MPAHASAQTKATRARVHYQNGLQAMEKKQYDTAIVHFTRALELRPRPAIYFALGLAHERSGAIPIARGFYERVLEYGKKRRGRLRKDVLLRTKDAIQRLDTLATEASTTPTPQPKTSTIQVHTAVPNSVVYDGSALLGPADGSAITLPTGPHTLIVRAPGYETATIRVLVKAKQPLSLQVALTAVTPESPPLNRYQIAGISTATIGGAALITGIILSVQVAGTRDDLKLARATGRLDPGSEREVTAWLERTEAASWSMYAIAGAGAISSLTVFLLDDDTISATVTPVPQGGLFALSGRW